MKRQLVCWLVVLCLGTSAFGQDKDQTVPRFIPGGVADPAARIGFFRSPTGGIDAVDLWNGKLQWNFKEADVPLCAIYNRLFALGGKKNQVHVFALDTWKEGNVLVKSKPIVFPEWVSVAPAYGRSFRAHIRPDMRGVWLSWEARAFYAGGAKPTPEQEKAARREASGVYHSVLDTGDVEALNGEKIATGKFFPMPADVVNNRAGREYTLKIKDTPGKGRIVQAYSEAMNLVWERDIAAPVILPPRR
jgi:hypothetical protein